MSEVSDSSLAGMIKDGGVVVFAIAVLLFLRDFRRELVPVLKDMVTTNTEVKAILSALLERERMRAAAAGQGGLVPSGAPSQPPHLVRPTPMYAPADAGSGYRELGAAPYEPFHDGETPPLGTFVEPTPAPRPPKPRTNPHGHPVVGGQYSLHGRRKTEGDG